MSFSPLLSAIFRSPWLLDESYAMSMLPTVFRLTKGEDVSFGESKIKDPEASFVAATKSNVPVYSVYPDSNLSALPQNSIAVVGISGPLMKAGGFCSYGMMDIANLITRLGNNDNVIGIAIDIDSPGGQVYGTTLLSDTIRNVNAWKPVIGFVNDGMAASAAMWIGTSCRELYATKRTDKFGSIGVYTTIADWNGHYKEYFKLHVEDIYAPQSTDKNKEYADALAGDDKELKEDLSVLAEQFIATIHANRGDRIKSEDWNTGKMFYAPAAKKMGLIDGIKSVSEIFDRIESLAGSRITSTKNNSKNMAFKKTLTAAASESFAVVEGGFLLTEEQLNSIEARLETAEQSAEAAAKLPGVETALEAATKKADDSAAKITELEAELKEFRSAASGDGTQLPIAGDTSNESKKVRSYNDPNSAINKKADRRLARS